MFGIGWGSLILLTVLLKELCYPLYYSTDIDVHRHWISLGGNKPWVQWYPDESSQWTLDYPPLFQVFQYGLFLMLSGSQQLISLFPAQTTLRTFVQPGFDELLRFPSVDPFTSLSSVFLLRQTVIISDITLVGSMLLYCRWRRPSKTSWFSEGKALFILGVLNVGLVIVDHIHFQYNGMLLGLLVLSFVMIRDCNYILASILVAVLVNMKHLYIGCVPVFFIYAISKSCFPLSIRNVGRLLGMIICPLSVFAISLGPFIASNQFSLLLSRLFPFGRGLCHAYWAPNIWALYTFADKILKQVFRTLQWKEFSADSVNFSGGKVGVFEHSVLPSITPNVCAIVTLFSIVPLVYGIWQKPGNVQRLIHAVSLSFLGMFMFGYHVHEKAILQVVLPLGLLVFDSAKSAKSHLLLSIIANAALSPLLFDQLEMWISLLLQLLYALVEFKLIHHFYGKNTITISLLWKFYLAGLLFIELNRMFFFSWIAGESYPFVPLLMVSVYSAIGISIVYGTLLLEFIKE